MSAPTVGEIATAIQTALTTIDGLRTTPFLSDSVNPPVAMVGIQDVDYHGAFSSGDVQHTFTVYLILSRASDRAGIQAMESYMSNDGAQSIRAAIEVDTTLGDVVDASQVTASGPPASISIGGVPYISVPFTVVVHASR